MDDLKAIQEVSEDGSIVKECFYIRRKLLDAWNRFIVVEESHIKQFWDHKIIPVQHFHSSSFVWKCSQKFVIRAGQQLNMDGWEAQLVYWTPRSFIC